MSDTELLKAFVDAFAILDDLRASREFDTNGDVTAVLTEPWNEDGFAAWAPTAAKVSAEALRDNLADMVGLPLPSLYEQLLRSYRWSTVDLGRLRLLPSLPPGLQGLTASIRRDQGLFRVLSATGFFRFGQGSDDNYDVVCFDSRHRLPDGDCRIVRFNHEEILCNQRIVEVEEVAPSFRRLIELTIDDANHERAIVRMCSTLDEVAGRLDTLDLDGYDIFMKAYGREQDATTRHRVLQAARREGSLKALPLFQVNLGYGSSETRREAIDGLLALKVPNAEELLIKTRTRAVASLASFESERMRSVLGAHAESQAKYCAEAVADLDAAIARFRNSRHYSE